MQKSFEYFSLAARNSSQNLSELVPFSGCLSNTKAYSQASNFDNLYKVKCHIRECVWRGEGSATF